MKKYFLIFGLFIFLLPNFAEAACPLLCQNPAVDSDCKWYNAPVLGWPRLGIIGTVEEEPAPIIQMFKVEF